MNDITLEINIPSDILFVINRSKDELVDDIKNDGGSAICKRQTIFREEC